MRDASRCELRQSSGRDIARDATERNTTFTPWQVNTPVEGAL